MVAVKHFRTRQMKAGSIICELCGTTACERVRTCIYTYELAYMGRVMLSEKSKKTDFSLVSQLLAFQTGRLTSKRGLVVHER
jgi:hypothetical protein